MPHTTMPAFYLSAEDLNSGPHVFEGIPCSLSYLPTPTDGCDLGFSMSLHTRVLVLCGLVLCLFIFHIPLPGTLAWGQNPEMPFRTAARSTSGPCQSSQLLTHTCPFLHPHLFSFSQILCFQNLTGSSLWFYSFILQ